MNALAHPSWQNRHAPALGLGMSLLVHALAIAWLLHAWLPAQRAGEAPAPALPIEVRLAPPRPPEAAAPADRTAIPDTAAAASAASRVAAPHAARRPARLADARRRAPAPAAGQDEADRGPASPRVIEMPAPAGPPPPADAADAADTAPSAGDGPAPTVDMAAARSAARLIGREGARSLVALPKRKPVVDPNGGRHADDPIEAARRKDCTTAYSGMGLLALIPLAKDAITGTGCKW